MNVIEVNNLNKTFKYYEKDVGLKNSIKNLFHRKELSKEAVKDISFSVEEGEIIGFLGPNGAGKTTTLKMLSGILFPTYGDVSILGYVPWERKKEYKKQFSIVMGQKSQLWWDLPANESLNLNKCIYEIDDSDYNDIVGELSELLDVKDLLKVQVRRLSLGERMKMELIASLIHRPKVLFLDEPTIGLDLISQNKIREFLKYYNQKSKTTIILTSHYMEDIIDLCKRVIIINQGSIVYNGNLDSVNDVFGQNKIIRLKFSKSIKKNILEDFGVIKEFDGYNATIEVAKADLKECSKAILDRLPVIDFNIEDISVDEGIMLLYQKGGSDNESVG